MSRTDSLSGLLSNSETRSASASLLVLGVVLGGSAATAACWARSRLYVPWRRRVISRQARDLSSDTKSGFVCVLDGLSKSHRQDAIKVASCFGVANIWVVANAEASDLRDEYQQTTEGSVLSVNGQSITVRTFATAKDCCDALADGGWAIHLATSKPDQDAPNELQSKTAIILATPFPSKAFVDAAQNTQTAPVLAVPATEVPFDRVAESDEYAGNVGSLPPAAALALTLHHLMNTTRLEASQNAQLDRAGLEKDNEAISAGNQPQQESPDSSSRHDPDAAASTTQEHDISSDMTAGGHPSNKQAGPSDTQQTSDSKDEEADSSSAVASSSALDDQSAPDESNAVDSKSAVSVIRASDGSNAFLDAQASSSSRSHSPGDGADDASHAANQEVNGNVADSDRASGSCTDAEGSSHQASEALNGTKPDTSAQVSSATSDTATSSSTAEAESCSDPAADGSSPHINNQNPASTSTATASKSDALSLSQINQGSPHTAANPLTQTASASDAADKDASKQQAAVTQSASASDASSRNATKSDALSVSQINQGSPQSTSAVEAGTRNASKLQAAEKSRLQAQAMRRSGVYRKHGMGTSSRASSSIGSPSGSVASVSTAGWPDYSPSR